MNVYILAGGLSSRMGRPKTSLTIGARTFVDRIIDASAPVFDEVVAVTRCDSEPVDRVRTIHERPHEGTSPMYGIEAALEDAREALAWVVGVDYPLVTSDLLRWFSDRFACSGRSILVPTWDGSIQTLCAGYSGTIVTDVTRRIGEGRFRLRELVADHDAEMVDEAEIRERFEGAPLMNVNTPVDLERARRIAADAEGDEDVEVESSR